MPKYSKSDKAEALARLRKHLKPQATKRDPKTGVRIYDHSTPKQNVYMFVRSVSRSGMSRVISTYVMEDGDLVCLDWAIAVACDLPRARDGVKIGGCGMDMCFALLDHATHCAFGEWVLVEVDSQGLALGLSHRRYVIDCDANSYNIRSL